MKRKKLSRGRLLLNAISSYGKPIPGVETYPAGLQGRHHGIYGNASDCSEASGE